MNTGSPSDIYGRARAESCQTIVTSGVGWVRTLKIHIQYLGTRYHGWQIQPDRPTIQGHLEAALGQVLNEPTQIVGAGRTDAGVHAHGQVASLATASNISLRGLVLGTNTLLPKDIRVMDVEEASHGFHARHHARSKDYVYLFSEATVLSPFLAATVHSVKGKLDRDRMGRAVQEFLGKHDFTAFCGPEGRLKETTREVTISELRYEGGAIYRYQIRANGFLQYLVRNIVGTLLEIGKGKLPPEAVPRILASRDRTQAGPTADPRGLTLERVHYSENP